MERLLPGLGEEQHEVCGGVVPPGSWGGAAGGVAPPGFWGGTDPPGCMWPAGEQLVLVHDTGELFDNHFCKYLTDD